MGSSRTNIPRATRLYIFDRDRNTCGLCGESVTERTRTVDHITPQALGGSDRVSNLRTAHKSCNSQKSDHFPTLLDIGPRGYDKAGEPLQRVIEAEKGSFKNLTREIRQQTNVGFMGLNKIGLF